MTNFSSNIDHIAKLDNSLAMSLTLAVNNVVLKAGSTYDVSTTTSMYNRITNITEYKTVTGTLSTTTIDTYLTSIKTQLESSYPVTVSHSTFASVNAVATFNTINVGLIVSTSGYYVRSMEMNISLDGAQQYNIDATLISPIELTPNILTLTPETLLSLNTVSESITNVNNVATTIVPNIAEILLASTNAATATANAYAAAASYDAFDDRYLGSKASNPVLDNDGNTLLVGALYWNSTTSSMYAWNGIAWIALPSSVAASIANVPAGSITSTTVQGALNELDAEKANNSDLLMAIGNINTPLLDMPLKNSLAMKSGAGSATFTRASTATYIDRYGVLNTAAVDTPRFEKEGYLNEGTSTNLLLNSNQFNTAGGWVVSNATTVQTITGPDGVANSAWYIDETTGVGSSYMYKSGFSLIAGTTYTASFFAKKAEDSEVYCWYSNTFFTSNTQRNVRYNFDTKVITDLYDNLQSKSVVELANGWVRISMTFVVDITTTGSANIIGSYAETNTTGSGIYLFGAQLEVLPFASSYIPTTTSTVTRARDRLKVPGPGNIGLGYNAKSIMVDSQALGTATGSRIFDIENFNYNMIRYSIDGVSVQTYYGSGPVVTSVNLKLKHRFIYTVGLDNITTNNILLYIDGVLAATQIGVGFSSNTGVPSYIHIGESTAGDETCFAHISNLRIYDKALTAYEATLA
jgi:hypothetical protein